MMNKALIDRVLTHTADAKNAATNILVTDISEYMVSLEPPACMAFVQELTGACETPEQKTALTGLNQLMAKNESFMRALKALHDWKKANTEAAGK